METIIHIKCPNCGKVLRLQSTPGMENMTVPCPVCGARTPFAQCKRVTIPQTDDKTELPSYTKNCSVCLVDRTTGRTYELPEGRNSVGRAHATSTATVQITTTDHGMSRLHATMEVVKTASGTMRCIISNAKNKNATYINGEKLEGEDELYLQNGDIIKMSRSEFTIEIL